MSRKPLPIVVILAVLVVATPIVVVSIIVRRDIRRTPAVIVGLAAVRTLPILVGRMTVSRAITMPIPALVCKDGSVDQAQHHSHKKDHQEKAFHLSLLFVVTLLCNPLECAIRGQSTTPSALAGGPLLVMILGHNTPPYIV
jgi:hypothetical protein